MFMAPCFLSFASGNSPATAISLLARADEVIE
jgi:hypothetical protein